MYRLNVDNRDDGLDRPIPKVYLVERTDSSIELEAFFWVAEPARIEVVRIRSDYVQTVNDRVEAGDIEMPNLYRELTGSVGTWPAASREGRPDATYRVALSATNDPSP